MTGDDKSLVKGVYEKDCVAEQYRIFDENYGLLRYEKIIAERFFKAAGRLLDIGCGSGRTTAPLSDMGFEVTGIDISQKMIETAKQIHPQCDFRVCDIKDMSGFRGCEFDTAFFSLNGIILLGPKEKETCIEQIHRVLKSNGIFAFSAPSLNADDDYVQNFIKSKSIDIDNYYSRLELGEMNHDEHGEQIKVYIPFTDDMTNLLEYCGFSVIYTSAIDKIAEIEEGINQSTAFVCRKIG